MDINDRIILDLKNKIGADQGLDFLSEWKGVPVMIKAHIQEVCAKSIIFRIDPPDSVGLAQDEYTLILHDLFIIGISGRILNLDLPNGTVELGEFRYKDRGFGDREMVRVEPNAPIEAVLSTGEATFSVYVVDLSLNGFGILVPVSQGKPFTLGQAVTLKLRLLDRDIEIAGKLLGVFPHDSHIRLAMSFSSDEAGSMPVTRYITRRRAEIRQEIQAAYQQAIGNNN